jgi:replicative DNA helicase
MFIYRDAYYLKEPKDGIKDYIEKHDEWKRQWDLYKNTATIIVEKHRHGPTGDITLFYSGEYGQFGNLAKENE